MIDRVTKFTPKIMADELLRLARHDRNWMEFQMGPDRSYRCCPKYDTWLEKTIVTGADAFGVYAASIWILDGPKIFRPTPEQCAALEQVELRLELHEYAQPYEAIMIDLPKGYEPFISVLCHHPKPYLTASLVSDDHRNDIVTTVTIDGRPIEVSVQKFDDDCVSLAPTAARALRVALNSCLALVNFGSHKQFLYPKEVERDRRLAKEDSDRGKRARERLESPMELVSFDQEVSLYHTEGSSEPGEPTGREMSPHWRRGHWAMQAHGPGHSLRKRILRKPVLVRADKFLGDKSDTSTSYK